MEDKINIYQPSFGNSGLSMITKCYNRGRSLLFPWPVTQQWLEDICFCASSWFIGLSAADLHTKWDFGTCLLVPSSETDYIKYSNGRSKQKKHQKDVACSCVKWSLRRVIGWHKKKPSRVLPLTAHGQRALVNNKSVATQRKRGRSVSLKTSSPPVCRPTWAVA